MTPARARKVLPTYCKNLTRYIEDGDEELIRIQTALIARLKKDAENA